MNTNRYESANLQLYLVALIGGFSLLPISFKLLMIALQGVTDGGLNSSELGGLAYAIVLMLYTTTAVYVWKLRKLALTMAKLCISMFVFGTTYVCFFIGEHYYGAQAGTLIGGVAPILMGATVSNIHKKVQTE